MQVEHKTEKGTICFLKIEDDAFDVKLTESKLYEYDFVNFKTPHRWDNFKKRNWRWGTHFEVGKWQLIGLTSEVTEDQSKMMVDKEVRYMAFKNYIDDLKISQTALKAFKSLMQHLKVYEVNPYGETPYCGDRRIYGSDKWKEAQERTGKWVVLFKPNEK